LSTAFDDKLAGEFSGLLLRWFAQHGRKDLPWSRCRDPYRIWVSEIMLQQTQVTTVIDYYRRFMTRFPTVHKLAAGDIDEVLHLWTGLGYYARARNMHKAARIIVAEHGGELPGDLEALVKLPGIGRSTAGAILAFAYRQRQPILDGNVKRVLARYHGIEGWPGLKGMPNKHLEEARRHAAASLDPPPIPAAAGRCLSRVISASAPISAAARSTRFSGSSGTPADIGPTTRRHAAPGRTVTRSPISANTTSESSR